VPINDVLPLEAIQCDATANVKCFGTWGQQWPNFDGFIYIQYAAPPYLAGISTIYLVPFGKVWLGSICWPPCAKPGDEAECRIYRGGKTLVPL